MLWVQLCSSVLFLFFSTHIYFGGGDFVPNEILFARGNLTVCHSGCSCPPPLAQSPSISDKGLEGCVSLCLCASEPVSAHCWWRCGPSQEVSGDVERVSAGDPLPEMISHCLLQPHPVPERSGADAFSCSEKVGSPQVSQQSLSKGVTSFLHPPPPHHSIPLRGNTGFCLSAFLSFNPWSPRAASPLRWWSRSAS